MERDRELQVWREQNMSTTLAGCSGGELPGRSREEEGRAEGEEGHHKMETELINAIRARESRETDAAEVGVTQKVASEARGTKTGLVSFQ